MLLLYLLGFSLIPRPVYLQPAQPNTSTTSRPLLQPTGGTGRGLDLGHLGSTIGGEESPTYSVRPNADPFYKNQVLPREP
jgi:hypothetical protein